MGSRIWGHLRQAIRRTFHCCLSNALFLTTQTPALVTLPLRFSKNLRMLGGAITLGIASRKVTGQSIRDNGSLLIRF